MINTDRLVTTIQRLIIAIVFILVVVIKPLMVLVLIVVPSYSIVLLVISLLNVKIPETSKFYKLTLQGDTANLLNLKFKALIKQFITRTK
jgi:hypothetical protein